MTGPLVSVIIPNYNYAGYIGEALESVLAQTYSNVEVIVVDDESPDNSLEVLTHYGDRIKVIAQKNSGVAAARNTGVAACSGEMVAFLDADDVWLPEKLEKQMKKMAADGEIGLVHCSMTLIDPSGEVCGEIANGKEGRVASDLLLFESGTVIGAGSTALVRREIFHAIGGFDTRLSTAADWDLSYRIAVDHKIAFVPEPLVLYRTHNSNMHSNIGAMEHDMLLGFAKAFAAGASQDRNLCYANLYKTLAGSYFHAGQYSGFARNAVKSVVRRPRNIGYFLGAFRRTITNG
jgi:glycosyltransferase involved in cell wall biosynthesis